MTTVRQGQAITRTLSSYEYSGGPPADVTGLTITITPTTGPPAAIGPTSTGVVHLTTGLDAYTWTTDSDQAVGDYAWVWNADGGLQSDAEIVTVIDGSAGAPLATVADLEARLGRDVTATEAAKADAALADASAALRTYCRRHFTEVEGGELILRPIGSSLRLPNRPVTAIAQLEQIGTAGTADRVMAASEWAFDGIDLIELWSTPYALSGIAPTGSYANTYRVVYDHGSAVVPAFIVGMTCRLVFRSLLAPSPTEGLVSEHIGQYSYQYGQSAGSTSPGVAVRLTDEDKRELVQGGYRRAAGSIQLRAN